MLRPPVVLALSTASAAAARRGGMGGGRGSRRGSFGDFYFFGSPLGIILCAFFSSLLFTRAVERATALALRWGVGGRGNGGRRRAWEG